MESIAYLVNRKFILIAVDTIYQTKFGNWNITLEKAKKVYKLNDHNLISLIGNPYKITDIHNYILKLNELNQNQNFDEILADLNDVFNNAKKDTSFQFNELRELLPKFMNENGEADLNSIREHLKDKPELISLLQDTWTGIDDANPSLTQLLVFGWDKIKLSPRIAHYISVGQNLSGNEYNDFIPNSVYVRFASSTVDIPKTTKVEEEARNQLTALTQANWDDNEDAIDTIIQNGKNILIEGLRKISPYKIEPSVVFYELSYKTQFLFQEPDVKLTPIEYNRES